MNLFRIAATLCSLLLGASIAHSQEKTAASAELTGQVDLSKSEGKTHSTAIVVWMKSVEGAPIIQPPSPRRFTLVQKNRMFSPHLLVVPVGSVVSFPNADPFFHNVFSLFNGERFDLGLYESGSSKDVNFSREGISYIFCNIHPEMSAVVLALATPYFAVADSSAKFSMTNLPSGDYDLHVWIEGTPQPTLDQLTLRIHIRPDAQNTVVIDASSAPRLPAEHMNKFGKPYDRDSRSSTY
jgi:plastocyanin